MSLLDKCARLAVSQLETHDVRLDVDRIDHDPVEAWQSFGEATSQRMHLAQPLAMVRERMQGTRRDDAGLAETSLMQHLAPPLVGEARSVDGLRASEPSHMAPPGWSLEGAAPCAWLTSDLSCSGVIGDSRGASPELGAALEALLIQHWTQMLQTLLDSDWPARPGSTTGSSAS